MAKSSNKRKNGKVKTASRMERARRAFSYILKDIVVCNAVTTMEFDGKRDNAVPKTVVYNRKTKQISPVSRDQEQALKKMRWNWDITCAILCRTQEGEVYLTKAEGVYLETPVLLTEMSSYLTDVMLGNYRDVNPMHALTMVWVAAPYDLGDNLTQEMMLAPVWKYDVLSNVITKWEKEHMDEPLLKVECPTLQDFVFWFNNQEMYRRNFDGTKE